MTDSEYIVTQCLNGHDVQVASSDLGKKLACPVCEVHFVARDQSTATPSTPPLERLVDANLNSLGAPDYPGTTEPLRYLWLFSMVVVFGLNFANLAANNTLATQSQTNTPLFSFVGCTFGLAGVAAMILQLVWIYRIHADAKKYGNYNTIPPVLAVLFSFIPFLNFIWTAVIIRLLAGFSDDRATSTHAHNTKHKSAKGIATWLIVISVIWMASSAALMYQSLGIRNQVIQKIKSTNEIAAGSPEFQRAILRETQKMTPPWMIVSSGLIPLIGGISYFVGVRRIIDSLYPALGSPQQE